MYLAFRRSHGTALTSGTGASGVSLTETHGFTSRGFTELRHFGGPVRAYGTMSTYGLRLEAEITANVFLYSVGRVIKSYAKTNPKVLS